MFGPQGVLPHGNGAPSIPAGQAAAEIKVVPMGSHFSDGPRSVQIRLTLEYPYRWGTPSAATVSLTSGG